MRLVWLILTLTESLNLITTAMPLSFTFNKVSLITLSRSLPVGSRQFTFSWNYSQNYSKKWLGKILGQSKTSIKPLLITFFNFQIKFTKKNCDWNTCQNTLMIASFPMNLDNKNKKIQIKHFSWIFVFKSRLDGRHWYSAPLGRPSSLRPPFTAVNFNERRKSLLKSL